MRSRTVVLALIALGLAFFSRPASANLITISVTGGPGIDQGAICLSGNSCPTTPAFTLSGTAAVSGSFVYNDVANTVSFTLNNLVPVSFSGAPFPQLAPGVFSATGIPVTSTPLGGGAYQLSQAGSATATTPSSFLPLSTTSNTPAVSGFGCLVNNIADQCGFSLGPGGWTVTDGSLNYNVFMTFNVNVVPEPATVALVGVGVLGLAVARQRRAV